MIVVNLTPHAVSVMPQAGTAVTFQPNGSVARIREITGPDAWLATDAGRVPIQQVTYADHVDGLPEASPGVLYLVSRVTAAAARRADLVFPQGEIRDDNGQIIGCRALGAFADPVLMTGGV